MADKATKAAAPAGSNLPQESLVELYRRMMLIRRAEEHLGEAAKTGAMPGAVHLYIGEEAIAVGVCAHLADTDWIASTHRGHGHFLAKGGDPRTMMAEIYGRRTGICQGKGGSMHVADFTKGIMGANGVVAGGIGLATGAALAAQLDGKGAVSVVFFGDGASNQGVLHEALNVSSLWKLPLILVCENNGFSEFCRTEEVTAGAIADRAKAFGVPGLAIDGNDVLGVWQTAGQAVRRAREGGGPTLIEARTYRQRGHVEFEYSFLGRTYREESEVEAWKARDPVVLFRRRLVDEGLAQASDLDAAERTVADTIAEAVAFAEASDWPEPGEAFDHMLA